MSVLDLSWNASGSVVGVAYGKPDHEDWCTHKVRELQLVALFIVHTEFMVKVWVVKQS